MSSEIAIQVEILSRYCHIYIKPRDRFPRCRAMAANKTSVSSGRFI
jgi:hypothetical protein